MLDLTLIREKTDFVKAEIARLYTEAPVNQIVELDRERRSLLQEVEALRQERNVVSKEIGRMKNQDARQARIRLYTIGRGTDVDESALVEMAGDRRRYYFAPDSRDLERIYGEIAYDIACPREGFWGRR